MEKHSSIDEYFICILFPPAVDTVPPVIACINDVVQTVNTGVAGATVTWVEPTATDNSGTATLTGRTHAPGNFFNVGTTQVTYTFTDGSGNSATCTFNVNVIECKLVLILSKTGRASQFMRISHCVDLLKQL